MLKTDIAFRSDLNRGFLPFINAFMVFLACITLATALLGKGFASNWDRRIANSMTLQIIPDMKNKNPKKEMDERIKNVSLILSQTPGVKSFYIMSEDEAYEMLKPWLGNIKSGDFDIVLPRLITAEISDMIPLNMRALEGDIKTYSSLITIETYETWMVEFKQTIEAVQTLLGLIIILILSTTGITIAYSTRSGLAINREVIEIMHLVGAHNSYIAKHFSNQMLKLSISGGILGYLISVLCIYIISSFAKNVNDGVITNIEFSNMIYGQILIIPIVAGIISKIVAIYTVNKTLNKMG